MAEGLSEAELIRENVSKLHALKSLNLTHLILNLNFLTVISKNSYISLKNLGKENLNRNEVK
jgi:hypothetical protein